MLFRSLMAVGIGNILNVFLYRSSALKTVHQRLQGKVLSVLIQELSVPISLVFDEKLLKILWKWSDKQDCFIVCNFILLSKLRNPEQVITLIQNGDLVIKGNFQVAQDFISLLSLAEFNLAEVFSPYIGDIAAEGISRRIQNTVLFLCKKAHRFRKYISETIIEEWNIAPGSPEVAWFVEKTKEVEKATKLLAFRVKQAEKK